MSDPLQRVAPGQSFSPSASTWNAFVDTANAYGAGREIVARESSFANEYIRRWGKIKSAITAGTFEDPTEFTFDIYYPDEASPDDPKPLIITTLEEQLDAGGVNRTPLVSGTVGTTIRVEWESPGVWVLIDIPDLSSSGGGSSTSCGCCDCFDCIPVDQATVTGCTAAPDGAPQAYLLTLSYPSYPEISGSYRLVNGVRDDDCSEGQDGIDLPDPSSSSGSSCVWTSCLITVERNDPTPPNDPGTGVYQWVLDLSVSPPTIELTFVSGDDVVGNGW